MINTVFLHTSPLAVILAQADRLSIPKDKRVILICRELTASEEDLLAAWSVVQLTLPGDRWERHNGRTIWAKLGRPEKLIAVWSGHGYPDNSFANVLRFLSAQKGMLTVVMDRDGGEYPITWKTYYREHLAMPFWGKILAMLTMIFILSAMMLADIISPMLSTEGSA